MIGLGLGRDAVARSKLATALARTKLGLTATARNLTTVTILLDMAGGGIGPVAARCRPSEPARLTGRVSAELPYGELDCITPGAVG